MLLALAVAAALTTVNVPDTIGDKRIDKAAEKSGLKVLLPDEVTTDLPDGAFGNSGPASRGRYSLILGATRGCSGASVCGIANFDGTAGEVSIGGKKVKLAKGRTGRYFKSTCGANCSFPRIEFNVGDTLYSISYKESEGRSNMVALANSAIRGGAR